MLKRFVEYHLPHHGIMNRSSSRTSLWLIRPGLHSWWKEEALSLQFGSIAWQRLILSLLLVVLAYRYRRQRALYRFSDTNVKRLRVSLYNDSLPSMPVVSGLPKKAFFLVCFGESKRLGTGSKLDEQNLRWRLHHATSLILLYKLLVEFRCSKTLTLQCIFRISIDSI